MTTIAEEAVSYIPPTTKNIADLDEVLVTVDVMEKTAIDSDGKTFSYKYIYVDGVEYRVPATVLKQLKVHIEENPKMVSFRVKKEGTGFNTSYTVVPK